MDEAAHDVTGAVRELSGMTRRDLELRRKDALRQLRDERDVWVATGSPDGVPHLIPVSLCWFDRHVVVAVSRSSRTTANVEATHRARLAIGDTRDVLIIDANGEVLARENEVNVPLLEAFCERTGWDVGTDPGDYVLLRFAPRRIQAWRNLEEMTGREIMGDGRWLVGQSGDEV